MSVKSFWIESQCNCKTQMLFFLSVLLDFLGHISDKKYAMGLSHKKGRMMMFSERNVAMLHCHSYIILSWSSDF